MLNALTLMSYVTYHLREYQNLHFMQHVANIMLMLILLLLLIIIIILVPKASPILRAMKKIS